MAALAQAARAPLLSISHGSTDALERDVGAYRVSDLTFPPRLELGTHCHHQNVVSVVLDGAVDEVSESGSFSLAAATAVAIPAGAPHSDFFPRSGARAVTVEFEAGRGKLSAPLRALVRGVRVLRAPVLPELARKLAAELRASDTAAPLALEGLTLELLAGAVRRSQAPSDDAVPPKWLAEVREILRTGFRSPLRLASIADAVNVHPAHLTRVFRAYHGISLAAYVRGLRLDWAAEQLAAGNQSLASLARDAGFADQSHFTHAFKRHTGVTPGRYRALAQIFPDGTATPFEGTPSITPYRTRDEFPPVLLWK